MKTLIDPLIPLYLVLENSKLVNRVHFKALTKFKLSLHALKIRARFTSLKLVHIYYVQVMFYLSFRLRLVLTLNRLLITYSRFFLQSRDKSLLMITKPLSEGT